MPIALHDAHEDSESAAPPQAPVETDEQLMLAFAGGRSEAFSELFCRYKQPLYGFFRRRLAESAHAQAEELTQETFLAVLRAASRYEKTALFRTYLYGIAFRILSAHRRKAAFRATFLGSTDLEREPGRPEALDSGLHIRQAISRLERIDREALMLREFEQLSYAEIAELLQLPLNTVRSRLFRARTALRNILSPTPVSPTTSARIEERP
jgi:RNA polymerase sigma-70 factor (ECF subfamily)